MSSRTIAASWLILRDAIVAVNLVSEAMKGVAICGGYFEDRVIV
jgi:hypothetical protein